MFTRRELPLEREEVVGIIVALMRIDAKLDEVLARMGDDEDGEAEEGS